MKVVIRAEMDGKFTPDASICGYPTDSDIIKLVLYCWLNILYLYPQAQLA